MLARLYQVHGATAEAPRFDASRFRNSNPGSSSSGLKGVKGSKPPTRTQVSYHLTDSSGAAVLDLRS